MRNICILMLLAIMGLNVQAQGPLHIRLEGGPAFPIGKFGNDQGAEDGYAKIGWNAAASVTYAFNDQLRAGVKAGFQQNNVEESAISIVETSPWKSTSLMGLLLASLPLNEDLVLEGEGGLGILFTQFPATTVTIGNVDFNRPAETGSGFAYEVGAGIKYLLAEDFALRLGANYLGAKPGFDEDGLTFEQQISVLSLNWGIEFRL